MVSNIRMIRRHSIEDWVFITVLPYAMVHWGKPQHFNHGKTSSRKVNRSSFYTPREQSERKSFCRFSEAIKKEHSPEMD